MPDQGAPGHMRTFALWMQTRGLSHAMAARQASNIHSADPASFTPGATATCGGRGQSPGAESRFNWTLDTPTECCSITTLATATPPWPSAPCIPLRQCRRYSTTTTVNAAIAQSAATAISTLLVAESRPAWLCLTRSAALGARGAGRVGHGGGAGCGGLGGGVVGGTGGTSGGAGGSLGGGVGGLAGGSEGG